MPRRKVGPNDRIRAAKACNYCKSSKKRCDSNTPCGLCVIKGRAERCTYEDSGMVVTPKRTQGADQRGTQASGLPVSSNHQLQSRDKVSVDSHVNTRESSAQLDQQSTMLLNSAGVEVFIGNVAAISFLQFLQKTLKRFAGPSSFTEGLQSRSMLEVQLPQNATPELFIDDLTYDQKAEAIGSFLKVSNGLLHLFSAREISQLLQLVIEPHTNLKFDPRRNDFVCLYLMIAIGFQARGSTPVEVKRGADYFTEAQNAAFSDMLQDPSIDTVRIFLLMAMYLLGACRRNTAFIYIGIASKAATILGLHIPYKNDQASAEERTLRRRIWMSLRVFDLFCSAILARPSSTPTIQRDEYEVDLVDGQNFDHRTLALSANYESCAIMDSIVQQFSASSVVDIQSVENYLQMLNEWKSALPDALRHTNSDIFHNQAQTTEPSDAIETAIGNIHVACSYYFCVIIVTRQFLVSRIISQIRSRRNRDSSRTANNEGTDERSMLFCKACVDSASFMTQLCREALESQSLFDNMCILKAWIFSAGLVLGFALLIDDDDWQSIHQDFSNARECLARFARLSAQAQQYYEILSNFSEAIDQYRHQIQMERKSSIGSNPYVERITSFRSSHFDGPPISSAQQSQGSTLEITPVSQQYPLAEIEIPYEEVRANFEIMSQLNGDDIGLQLIWDTYSLQNPDILDN